MIASNSNFTYIEFLQNGAGPLILSWINEICSDDTEKRALLVATANDLAYVVQAIVRPLHPKYSLSCTNAIAKAPNFVWKTTDFPRATKGYIWSIIVTLLLSKFFSTRDSITHCPNFDP